MAKNKSPLETALDRIKKEIAVFDECYAQPIAQGVTGLYIPDNTKKHLHEWSRLFQGPSFPSPRSTREAHYIGKLTENLRNMGEVMGFDLNGYLQEEPKKYPGIDMAQDLPEKNGTPYFGWKPPFLLNHYIELNREIEDTQWAERETGPIHNTEENNAMHVHGLTIHKTDLKNSAADTMLSIDCGWSFSEGFMYAMSFNFNDGSLIGVHDGGHESDIHSVLGKTQDELGVTPQHILCLLYTSPSPRDCLLSRMPSSA